MIYQYTLSLTCSTIISSVSHLGLPPTRLKTKSDRAFEVAAPTPWNAFPIDISSAVSSEDHFTQTGLCLALCCLMCVIL